MTVAAVSAAGDQYGHLTSDDLPEPPGWCPPIPTAADPDTGPPVVDPSPEPLVDAADRFLWLNAYQPVYPAAAPGRLWVRATVADQLTRAQAALPAGYGLAVFDAWRPLGLQQALYDDAYANPDLPDGFVAPPSADPAFPPPHLTGGAVDVTLTGSRSSASPSHARPTNRQSWRRSRCDSNGTVSDHRAFSRSSKCSGKADSKTMSAYRVAP